MSPLFGKIVVVLVLGLTISGCVLAPAIGSFQKLGVTAGDRQNLFQTRFTRYQESLTWGRAEDALAFVEGEKRREIGRDLRRILSEERIVEIKIGMLEFSEDAYDAQLEVLVRSYKAPYYVVNERMENQTWKFGLSGGWKLVSREDQASAASPRA